MKIAVLAKIINQKSGARAPIRLAEQFASKGHQVDFYALDLLIDSDVLKSLKAQKIKVTILKANTTRVFGNIVMGWKLLKALRGKEYDFLSAHVHTPLQLAAWLSKSGPIIRTHYGIQYSSATIFQQAKITFEITLVQRLIAWAWDQAVFWDNFWGIRFAHYHASISHFLQLELKNKFHVDSALIYLGSEVAKFKLTPKKRKSGEVQILSVSRIVPYKGFDILIKIVNKLSKKVPGIRLTIIGSIADPLYLEKLKQMQTDRIEIVLNTSDSQLAQYYSDCDIYASGDLWVPWSLTPLEASHFSKSLLGFDRGAMSEIISDGENGLLARNEKEYEEKLLKLIKNKELRDNLGKKAQEVVVKKFNWSKCADDYLKFYKESVGDNN